MHETRRGTDDHVVKGVKTAVVRPLEWSVDHIEADAATAPQGSSVGLHDLARDGSCGDQRKCDNSDLIDRLQSLTPQQARVLGMLAEGLLNKQIAYELGVSEATIKAHVSAVLHKLGVDSRTQAVILLSRIGTDPLQPTG